MNVYRTSGIAFAGTSVHLIHIGFSQLTAFADVASETGFRHIAEVIDIADFVSLRIIRPVFLEFAFELHYFVGVEREVHAYPVFEIFSDTIVPVQGKFNTTVAHLTQILGSRAYDTHRKIEFGMVENVRSILIIIVYLTRQTVVEEAEIKSDVGGSGTFPMQLVVA